MITFDFKVDLKELNIDNRKVLDYLATQALSIINQRTERGVGLKGAFPAYSPEYAKDRRDSGRSTDVRLTLTGAMMNSLSAVARDATSITIGAKGAAARTYFATPARPRRRKGVLLTRVLKKHMVRKGGKLTANTIANAEKALYVTTGGRGGPAKARPFVGLTDAEKRIITEKFAEWVKANAFRR